MTIAGDPCVIYSEVFTKGHRHTGNQQAVLIGLAVVHANRFDP